MSGRGEKTNKQKSDKNVGRPQLGMTEMSRDAPPLSNRLLCQSFLGYLGNGIAKFSHRREFGRDVGDKKSIKTLIDNACNKSL
jgi:hypothetical protein